MAHNTMKQMSFLIFFWGSTMATAAPVIEANERLEINWGTLRLRYYGEATLGSGTDGFKTAEKKAWHDGFLYAGEAVRNINVTANEPYSGDIDKLSEDARQAAKQISTATYSYNTTYFSDGTVRVYLESPLAKALETSVIHFRQKEAPEPAVTQYTGILINPDQPIKPRATYQIVDENGAVLFEVHDMAQQSYKRGLMGRWFTRPSPGELAEAIGKTPLLIAARVNEGRFEVKREVWDKTIEGHRSLLVNGTIAIALP